MHIVGKGRLASLGALILLVLFYQIGRQSVTPPAPSTATHLIFLGDFETGDLARQYMGCVACCSECEFERTCPTVVSAEGSVKPRAGNFMMKSFLNPQTSNCPYRTEAIVRGENNVLDEFKIGSEYWLGLSIYIPGGQPLDMNILAQFHGQPDYDIGEKSRNPHMSLGLRDGILGFEVKWDSKRNTNESGKTVYEGEEYFILGAPETDKWIDWVFHFKLAYDDDGGGFLEVYQDGQKVIDYIGPNCYNDAYGPYFKMGIYNVAWENRPDIGVRIVYHDELRIAGSDATYEDVAPPWWAVYLPVVARLDCLGAREP